MGKCRTSNDTDRRMASVWETHVESRRLLIEAYAHFADATAKRWANRCHWITYDDLLSEMQEALIRAVDTYAHGHGTSPRSYIITCMVRSAMNFFRRSRRHHDYRTDAELARIADDAEPEINLSGESDRMMARMIEPLGERERLVVLMRYRDGLTLREVAALLGVSKQRIQQISAKALQAIRRENPTLTLDGFVGRA